MESAFLKETDVDCDENTDPAFVSCLVGRVPAVRSVASPVCAPSRLTRTSPVSVGTTCSTASAVLMVPAWLLADASDRRMTVGGSGVAVDANVTRALRSLREDA